MNTTSIKVAFALAAVCLTCQTSQAQTRWPAGSDGFYRLGTTEISVTNGIPRSSQIIDHTLIYLNQWLRTSGMTGGITSSQTGNRVFVELRAGSGSNSLHWKITITNTSSVSGVTATVSNLFEVDGVYQGQTYSDSFTVTETLAFQSSVGTIEYTGDAEYPEITDSDTITLRRVSVGTGTELNPFVPPFANWTTTVRIQFPVNISTTSVVKFDPPLAKGFDYAVAAGRTEKVTRVYAPKGFGTRIKVYAAAARTGPLKLVGTIASGKTLDLTRLKGFAKGAVRVRLEGMNPKPDLAKRAPYPVGFGFGNLRDAMASLTIKSIR